MLTIQQKFIDENDWQEVGRERAKEILSGWWKDPEIMLDLMQSNPGTEYRLTDFSIWRMVEVVHD